MALLLLGEESELGRITLDGQGIHGSNRGAQEIADAALKRNGGDARAAYADLRGYCNGYLSIVPEDPGPSPEAAGRLSGTGGMEFE